MNMMQARKALSPEQRKVLDTKVLDLNAPPDELIKFLTPIALFDAAVGKHLSSVSIGCVSALATVTAVITFFIAMDGGWTLPRTAIFVTAAAITAITWFAWLSGRKADLSDNLRFTALPLLRILREDVARGETVALHMDLRQPTDKAKKTGASKPYKRGRYYHIVDTLYSDPWLTLKTRLNDGALLGIRVTGAIRVINRKKRGSSGKVRMNTVKRQKTQIKVQLAVRKDTYDVVAPAHGVVRSTDKRHVLSLRRVHKFPDMDPVAPIRIIDAVADATRSVRRRGKEARA